jgi:hypothetical protein
MKRLVGVSLRPGIVIGVLLIATLACYTPRQIQAEREEVAQFALLEESIYVPPDATLLAEVYSSAQHRGYASAGAVRIYSISRSCEEIVAEYEEAMTNLGGTATPMGDCEGPVWLNMRTAAGAHFGIDAEPGEQSPLSDEWRLLREQHKGLYYASATLFAWYEEP